MNWTVAVADGVEAGTRALVAGRTIVTEADVVLWPARRGAMVEGAALNVVDLRGVDPADDVRLGGAGLLLVGSAVAFGAWAARTAVPIGVVPAVVEVAAAASARMEALHLLVGEDESEAQAAADWAALRGMACGVAEGSLAAVTRLGPAPVMAPGAVVLDLRTGAGRIDASPTLLGLLAVGAPVLFGEDTPLRSTLEGVGAGWRFDDVVAGLERVAGLGAAAFERASGAALKFVGARFGADGARAAFERAVDGALRRQQRRAADWARLGPGGHVLVISDEAANLRAVRVHQPFDALVRAGAIEGYCVLSGGAFVSGTVTAETRFSAIWVQRSVDPQVQLLLRVLGRGFVYDLDDNLLVSPSYRRAFAAEAIETATGLVRECAVLSSATRRLAEQLGRDAIVTPNLAFGPARRVAGPARMVVWASSDVPALAGSRAEIERAVRDFAGAHGLPVLCIGARAPEAFAAAGLVVEATGLLAYPAYLARLRAAAPGILVAPLETRADTATQGFVDAKSDIKVIEARLAGLQGVFSAAAPYAGSDLAPEILCENSYPGWLAGLERARLACERPGAAAAWPGRRDADGAGLMPWAAALRRAAMAEASQLSGAKVLAALEFVAAQAATLLESPAVFDEADYLRRHPDVAAAVAQGVVASGYRHFVQSGFGERRVARRVASAAGEASFWWTRLLHEVGGLETRVAARGREIAGLRERVALRGAGPRMAGREAVDPGWLRWGGGTRALPCPICGAEGPHQVVVQASGHVLVRCDGCGTRFYVDRVEHAYEGEESAAILQFGLEQNASLHHQTRLLYGREGASSVLDVGCGFGFGVDLAAEVLGWRAVGVDPSPAAAAGRVQLGADIRVDYLSAATELGAPFDRVVASEVLEHVADPYAMLALLRARLAPGGVLTVTTPNGDAVRAGEDVGRLTGILAPGVHLTLFTEGSLTLALRRAGFGHVAVEVTTDTLVAEASDLPLGARADGDHAAAYRAYLEGLMRRAPVGSALWNGAAGRLLTLLMPTAAATVLEALFGEIAAAWRARGIDVETLVLPAALTEAEIRTVGAAGLGEQRPFNLAGVLLHRATLADRAEDAAAALGFAAAAHRIAVETRRVLQLENLIDLDLKRTAWRARLLMAEYVGALAPGLAATVAAGIARGSPGELADWDDPPAGAVIEMVAEVFVAAVAADRFDEARRVEEWVADADAVIAALAGRPELLLPTLFMRGMQRLEGYQDPAGALRAFERLAGEAQRLGATDYMEMAREHMRLAMTRSGETG